MKMGETFTGNCGGSQRKTSCFSFAFDLKTVALYKCNRVTNRGTGWSKSSQSGMKQALSVPQVYQNKAICVLIAVMPVLSSQHF